MERVAARLPAGENVMKYVATALAAVCMVGGTQAALANSNIVVNSLTNGMETKKREAIQLRVPANVDVSDPAAAIALRNQATRAIEKACNPGDRLNADMSPDFQCRREMAASLELALRQRAFGG
jgi:hypothetical protein